VWLSGRVLGSWAFDLGAAKLTVASLLAEADGAELVQGGGGERLLPLSSGVPIQLRRSGPDHEKSSHP